MQLCTIVEVIGQTIEEYPLPQATMRTTLVMIILTLCALLVQISAPTSEVFNEVGEQNFSGEIGGGGQPGAGKFIAYPHVLEDTLPSSVSISDTAWLNEQEIIVVGWYAANVTVGNQTLTVESEGVNDLLVARISLRNGVVWVQTADCTGNDSVNSVAIETDNDGEEVENSTIWIAGSFHGEMSIGSQVLAASAPDSESRVLIAKLDTDGNVLGAAISDGTSGYAEAFDMSLSENGAYIVGQSNAASTFGAHSITHLGSRTVGFIAHVSNSGVWDSVASTSCCSASNWHGDASFNAISLDSDGNILISGFAEKGVKYNGTVVIQGVDDDDSDGIVMKLNSDYDLIWIANVGSNQKFLQSTGNEHLSDISVNSDNVHVVGTVYGSQSKRVSAGGISVHTRGGHDAFIGILDLQNGTWAHARGYGGTGDDSGGSVHQLSDNLTIFSIGHEGSITLAANLIPGVGEKGVALLATESDKGKEAWSIEASAYGLESSPGALSVNQTGALVVGNILSLDAYSLMIFEADVDGDGVSSRNDAFPNDETQHSDMDSDGYGDSSEGTTPDDCPNQWGNSTLDGLGCPDTDGDGASNMFDKLPDDPTQWKDADSDGYGDNQSGNQPDSCTMEYGESSVDVFGCIDDDGDGWSNTGDQFVQDASQWQDSDLDGFGDNLLGVEGDSCPDDAGYSTEDRFGCLDSDGDGWSDRGDDFDDDVLRWSDLDGDGVADNTGAPEVDVWPNDATQWEDSDSDGHGDNRYGTLGDHFPEDPTQWSDLDGDGRGDDPSGNNPDSFTYNPTQWEDSDGDGWGDNSSGLQADRFPDEPTQWSDLDGDGCGDNPEGVNPDAFQYDFSQCHDRDGDGWGDNEHGNRADLFPDDSTQWRDDDGDGLGDNQSGINADPYLNDQDNDGYNDSIDPRPLLASPGDLDNDGCIDEEDAFPDNDKECKDSDGDGIGDNEDIDDDNDGWSDAEELRLGTDAYSAGEKPVNSFELVLPGTEIGLGAWDLVGVMVGLPMASWFTFGMLTRYQRGERFAERLRNCQNLIDLEDASKDYENALKYRLLGPHQGLMLERVRSNVENDLQESELGLSPESMSGYSGPSREMSGVVDDDGWEWLEHDGSNWYRDQSDGRWRPWNQ